MKPTQPTRYVAPLFRQTLKKSSKMQSAITKKHQQARICVLAHEDGILKWRYVQARSVRQLMQVPLRSLSDLFIIVDAFFSQYAPRLQREQNPQDKSGFISNVVMPSPHTPQWEKMPYAYRQAFLKINGFAMELFASEDAVLSLGTEKLVDEMAICKGKQHGPDWVGHGEIRYLLVTRWVLRYGGRIFDAHRGIKFLFQDYSIARDDS